MFFLKDLPTDRTLGEFAKRYSDLDPSALKACVSLLRTGSDMLVAFEKHLGRHDLSQGSFLTLIVMNRAPEDEVNPSVLAEQVGVTRATMTGLLDRLERKGYVARFAHSKDRRKVTVQLTLSGRSVLNGMLPDYYGHIAKLMKNLGESERQNLILLLEKVNQGLETLPSD